MKKFLLAVMAVFLMAQTAMAAININVSGSSCEFISSDTIRLRFISTDIPGYSSIWADFKWDPNIYHFVPTNASSDTLSVVGDWTFTVDYGCNSTTDNLYLTLNSDSTINCTPTSAYDSSCKSYVSGGATGTWTLSGNVLTLYISDIRSDEVAKNSKITGDISATVSNNAILDGKMYSKSSTTYDYTKLYGCFTANRSK